MAKNLIGGPDFVSVTNKRTDRDRRKCHIIATALAHDMQCVVGGGAKLASLYTMHETVSSVHAKHANIGYTVRTLQQTHAIMNA